VQVSPAELEIMKVLWRAPGIGASEVFEALSGQKDWNIRTVKTLISRLVDKGALSTEQEGRRFLYSPLIKESDYQKKAARQIVDQVFNGRAAPLVAHLAEAGDLSAEDIAELEALLGKLKK
jgi:BlaI family transcriptional regulator, penicillinase repressor